MITPVDEVVLRQLVGPATFFRATVYANRGAVRSRSWEDDSRVAGEVQGTALHPYFASVKLTRDRSARLSAFEATCTCPVGLNCKHAVALLLAKEGVGRPDGVRPRTVPDIRSRSVIAPPPARPSDWERHLGPLLHAGEGAGDAGSPDLGLLFELVAARPQPGNRSGARQAGILVRPVTPGRGGNWVKTGISWAKLDYHAYGGSRSSEDAERLRLVKELLALSNMASRRYSYSYHPEEVVWLESISSRRIWDLLSEARALRIPLLRSGRQGLPVTLRSSPAVASIDVTRTRSGLRLQPHVSIEGDPVPLECSLLIGHPAHGVAWWGPTPADANPPLVLAPFADPVDDTVRSFLAAAPLTVPKRDEERFLADFYPMLRRRVELRSSDESVDLPEASPRLILTIEHRPGHRMGLRWMRCLGSSGPREHLWDTLRPPRDRMASDAIVEAVTVVACSMPALLELTAFGQRLAPAVELEGMAAVQLSELLPALEEIPGVEIEQAGTMPDYQEATSAPVVSMNGAASGDGDWFDLTVTVTVEDEEVPFVELFVALADGRSHLILPSGTYFSLDSKELCQLAELIAEARALHDAPSDGIRLGRFQASLWEDLVSIGVVTSQAGAWEASVRSLAEATDRIEHAPPAGLCATLRPYQQLGFNWLAYLREHGLGGVLADDMGLGKTLQALALVCHTTEGGLTEAPYLVVAPTSVVENWAAECRRFAPGLHAVTVTETTGRRGATLAEVAGGANVVITSYSLFRLEYDHYEAIDWAGLFLDEAQFTKNRNSQAYRRAKTLPVAFKVAITGTPMENNLMELWSLLSITAPGLFASPDRFEDYYRGPIEKQRDTGRLDQLRRRVRPLMLRRTKEQVAVDLPDKQEQVLEMDLHPRHKKLYQTYLQRERQKVLGLLSDMDGNRFEIFRSLTLLRQASLDMSLVDAKHATVPSTKLDALMEMLEEIVGDGHRVLVFSQFTRFLSLARQRVQAAGIEHCYLDGRTRKRATVISDFRGGTASVFLISLKAGGFGLNLTEADYCILLDPWWNPATEAQAVDRIHRIGQTKKVMVYRLVAKDTLEEKVMTLKAKKAALFASVMDEGGFESGAMTAADIGQLLS